MKLRGLIVAAIAGCAVLAFATQASATPPERFTESGTDSEVLDHCDGFDLILTGTTTRYFTVFFDENGLDVRYIIRGRVTETLTNSVTGKSVVNRGVFTDFLTRIDGTDEFTHSTSGFDFHGQVEGIGRLVFQNVGRTVYDPETGEIIFRAGHTNFPTEGFCAILA